MFNINEVVKRISRFISEELNLDDEKEAVINYGIFALIQMCLSISLVIIWGAIFNVMVEALIASFASALLRKSSGGVHSEFPGMCNFIGTVVSVLIGLMCKYLNVNLYIAFLFIICSYLISYYIICKLAPVDSKSKPIRTANKRKRLRRNSLIIVSIYLSLSILNIFLYFIYCNYNFIVYSLCITVGLLWQSFTLTYNGHLVLSKIDKISKFMIR